ncbi:hypothetical protein [Actinomadura harenae]|uniref:hypothetical protein n=1 Tax=Actinomadura harenae TaxID=2483351 RepID=UPI0011C4885B|nr:hypothetical protein [Actinomadura harenae]
MLDTPDNGHARLVQYVHAAATSAVRADHNALGRAVHRLVVDGALDQGTMEFLQQAPRTVIALTTALNAILDLHRPSASSETDAGCRACGTSKATACRTLRRMADVFAAHQAARLPCVDAAEAWRRARARQPAANRGEVVSTVTEIADAYVVRSMVIEPPSVPTRVEPSSERVLLVDKTTGQTVIWPLMPLPALERGYARYRQGARTVVLTPRPQSADDRDSAQSHRALTGKVATWTGSVLRPAKRRRQK